MKHPMTSIIAVAITTLLTIPAALGCGDKLAAIGGGLRFDLIHRADHPGSLLVYLNPHSRFKVANDDLQLVSWLQHAGNKVVVVDTPEALGSAMAGAGRADLVLLDAADARELMSMKQTASGLSPILPILYQPTPDELASVRSFGSCYAQAGRRKQWQFVQQVDRAVENFRTGKISQCVGS